MTTYSVGFEVSQREGAELPFLVYRVEADDATNALLKALPLFQSQHPESAWYLSIEVEVIAPVSESENSLS